MENAETITQTQKGILTSLTKSRIKTWAKAGISEEMMKSHLLDPRWRKVMMIQVLKFEAKYF